MAGENIFEWSERERNGREVLGVKWKVCYEISIETLMSTPTDSELLLVSFTYPTLFVVSPSPKLKGEASQRWWWRALNIIFPPYPSFEGNIKMSWNLKTLRPFALRNENFLLFQPLKPQMQICFSEHFEERVAPFLSSFQKDCRRLTVNLPSPVFQCSEQQREKIKEIRFKESNLFRGRDKKRRRAEEREIKTTRSVREDDEFIKKMFFFNSVIGSYSQLQSKLLQVKYRRRFF